MVSEMFCHVCPFLLGGFASYLSLLSLSKPYYFGQNVYKENKVFYLKNNNFLIVDCILD